MVAKCANTRSPITPSASSRPQPDRERLVVIVLADQDDAPRAVSGLERRAIAVHRRKRRLLHQHVLARRERLQCEIEVESMAAPR